MHMGMGLDFFGGFRFSQFKFRCVSFLFWLFGRLPLLGLGIFYCRYVFLSVSKGTFMTSLRVRLTECHYLGASGGGFSGSVDFISALGDIQFDWPTSYEIPFVR